jgi:hypothetical protein
VPRLSLDFHLLTPQSDLIELIQAEPDALPSESLLRPKDERRDALKPWEKMLPVEDW